MVFISRLRLKNFKSFKAADVQLPKTFVCFAGPNGSGKSNLCDAIRFVMGEISLKSLRAKKVTDLIHTGSRTAEVSLVLQSENDGHGYEIRRAIREDGKIRYRLNDKKTTRGSVVEALKKHNLDSSGRNTIAQGEVQRIINMNGKERRQIIDSVAGIADFEEKKKEALNELNMVDTRIKDSRLVLGERKAFLDELEREKEIAIKYTGAKKSLANAKGTLLKNEMERLEKELTNVSKQENKLNETRKIKEQEMADVETKVTEIDSKRSKTSEELQSKQKTNTMIRRLEELKASCGSKKQLVLDKETFVKGIKTEKEEIERETSKEKEVIAAIEKELAALRRDLKKADEELTKHGGAVEDDRIAEIRKTLEHEEKELAAIKEKLTFFTSEIEAKKQLIDAKKTEQTNILPNDERSEEKQEDMGLLRKEVDRIAKEIDRSFSKTKEINSQMGELDKQMLELKEKLSIFKVRSSPQLANPALSFISELTKPGSGIYGTVADLISFDPEYSTAVEAAGGARLLYVVVDGIDRATEVIEKLKKAKAGRATFIPLDSIRTPAPAKAGKFSSILDVVECKSEVRRAMEYVFADTLLVDGVADAKKLGIGTGRMVTLEGEIFERSGIVSGGRAQSGLLNNNQLRKIENEFNDVKSTKDSFLQELYTIREEESKMRAEKAKLEIQIKTHEMKEKIEQDRRKEIEHLIRRKEQITDEIKGLEESIKNRSEEREKLTKVVAEAEGKVAGLKEKLKAAEGEFRRSSEESSKKRADLSATVSSLKATIEGKTSEIEIRNKEHMAKQERSKKLNKDEKEALEKIREVQKQIGDEEKELTHTEEKMKSASKEIEQLFEQMKSYEDELQEMGKKRGQIRIELDKAMKDINQMTVKTATAQTRLEDIKAEFAAYGDAEFLKVEKEELSNMVRGAEEILSTIGNVNMAAIEMYDKKKAEMADIEQKIEKLDQEREAILSMIGEIEEHKKEAFSETFNAVSDNFSKMFKYIQVGQGHLYLSNPSDPFESGLFIKLRRNNQEHALDALSGGEKTLIAMMFVFALQMFKPAPFYILDEVDAALDKANSKNLADLVNGMSKDSQFIMVTHNDTVMSNADSVIGVTKVDGVSKLVGIKLKQAMKEM
ncbi:Chromosome partition protein Smc [Candidatus Bilamarchaeum dharawalense]|uniref:Chromosome partition protein Smc n=1 Tax=Candidatus Bilamarchaeum dharawalense TaxID=2885759 RepID=A0A5E4LMU5_9ARCH|nr:Chromosome partition protein Smc [Candidatus Bilamarchaeum dharawalense]